MERKITSKAKKQDMKRCFTCLLCNELYVRATTINECLHTFCRKCIEDKLIGENLKACPICNADLGVAPLDKLRTDHIWDDLRENVFKPKPKSVKAATETVAASLRYSGKKRKSLSSLLVTPSREVSVSPESNPDVPLEPDKLVEETEAVPQFQSSSTPVSNFRKRPRTNPRPKENETRLEPEQPHKESENGFKILLNIEQDNGLAGASTSKGCIRKENNLEIDFEEIPVSSDDLGKSLSTDKEVKPLKSNDKEDQDYVSNSGDDTEGASGEKPNNNNNGEENQENGNLPSSYVNKYLVKNLNLESEDELDSLYASHIQDFNKLDPEAFAVVFKSFSRLAYVGANHLLQVNGELRSALDHHVNKLAVVESNLKEVEAERKLIKDKLAAEVKRLRDLAASRGDEVKAKEAEIIMLREQQVRMAQSHSKVVADLKAKLSSALREFSSHQCVSPVVAKDQGCQTDPWKELEATNSRCERSMSPLERYTHLLSQLLKPRQRN